MQGDLECGCTVCANLLELHDVWMEELAVDHDLPRHKFGDAMATLDKLDGNLLPCGNVHCQLDLAKCSLPKLCMSCRSFFQAAIAVRCDTIWRHHVSAQCQRQQREHEAISLPTGSIANVTPAAVQHLQAGMQPCNIPTSHAPVLGIASQRVAAVFGHCWHCCQPPSRCSNWSLHARPQ